MLVLGIDLETSGLDPAKDFITEVGAVLFDGTTWQVIEEYSSLVYDPEMPPLSEEIVKITKITDQMLKDGGVMLRAVLDNVLKMARDAGAFVAHNAQFDKAFFISGCTRVGLLTSPVNWICSKTDVKTHHDRRCTKLSHLGVDYGLTVDGAGLHRALGDVLLMGKMLKATGLTAEEIIKWAQEPFIYIEAQTEKPWEDGGESVALAKADGYQWSKDYGSGIVVSKRWSKRIKVSEEEAEFAKKSPFLRTKFKVNANG